MSVKDVEFSIIDNDSDDEIHELRRLAITSMEKHDKKLPIDFQSYSPIDNTKNQLSHVIIAPTFSTSNKSANRKRMLSHNLNVDSKKSKIESKQFSDDKGFLPDFFTDNTNSLLKEEELKLKLLRSLQMKKDVEKKDMQQLLSESDDNDDFRIFTQSSQPKEIITDSKVLKCQNLILQTKNAITEINKTIHSASSSIRVSLAKSKKISMQIENLKTQKVEVHKEIAVNRRKIVDLQKTMKLKSLELLKYDKMKKRFMISTRLNSEVLRTRFNIDCNHIICPYWLNDNCVSQNCIYQHPKIRLKPTVEKAVVNGKIREIDNIDGHNSKLNCDACQATIFISTPHLNDDWHCKSCCQQLIALQSSSDVLYQLVSIWHHIYKRLLMSKLITLENRNPSILSHLFKCSEAIISKLLTTIDLSPDQMQSAAYHIILTFRENNRVDDLVDFIKRLNYQSNIILFALKFDFPTFKMLQLLINVINYQIDSFQLDQIHLLLTRFCSMSKCMDQPIIDQLMSWLEQYINKNSTKYHDNFTDFLTNITLSECLSPQLVLNLNLSLSDLHLGDTFWYDRKGNLSKIMDLYQESDNDTYLLLAKYVILCNFFTGDEDSSLELCQRLSAHHYAFQILLSKLSLKYNTHIAIDANDKVLLIEHAYNKSEWLLVNRSIHSAIKVLENISQLVYGNMCRIDNSQNAIDFYDRFLEIDAANIHGFIAPGRISDIEIKSIRETSPIWLCYIHLLFLTNHWDRLDDLIQCDKLLSLSTDHLNRIAHDLIIQYAHVHIGHQYLDRIKYLFLFIRKSVNFCHFFDLFSCVDFDKLPIDTHLETWLFFIDFCSMEFSEDEVDLFLIAASRKLIGNVGGEVFHHIVMCYPIRVWEIWLNYIQWLLNTDAPLYQLIDNCQKAANQFPSSILLWKQYQICAAKTGDNELIKKVGENHAKFAINLA